MKDEIKEILDYLKNNTFIPDETKRKYKILHRDEVNKLLDYITNLQEVGINKYQTLKDLEQENEKLKREVAKLHIIQEEYGSHIENTHIIDDYQKTYFMSNKYLIELKNGKFVDINVLNDEYEDYKSRCDKAIEYIENIDNLVCINVDNYMTEKEGRIFIDEEGQEDLLNILQGSDK